MTNFIFLCDGRTFKITGRGRIATGTAILLPKTTIDRDNLYLLSLSSFLRFHSWGIERQGNTTFSVGIPDDLEIRHNDYIVG